MTWTFAGQLAIYASIVCLFAFGVGRWLAWDFDRRWGKTPADRTRKPGPAA